MSKGITFLTTRAPSVREIEQITGVSKATVSRIRRGADFSVSTAKKLLPVLGECPCCGRKLKEPEA